LNIIDLADGNEWESGGDGYIIKAGQGMLEYNWHQYTNKADADGKPWGLYWVIDSRYSPENHKAAIKRIFPAGYFGRLGLWLDIEKPNINMADTDYLKTPYHGYKLVNSVWHGVQTIAGKYPGMYFGPGTWDLIMSGAPANIQQLYADNCECWIAHYTNAAQPSMRGKWTRWAMWQWRGEPDYNRVNVDWWDSLDIQAEDNGTITQAEDNGTITQIEEIGGNMKGTARSATNIKATISGQIPAVTQLTAGQYVYGTLFGYVTTGDLIGFSHFYKTDGTKIELGCVCKAFAGNLTITNENEPINGGVVPASVIKTADIEIFSDGSVNIIKTDNYPGL